MMLAVIIRLISLDADETVVWLELLSLQNFLHLLSYQANTAHQWFGAWPP